MVYKHPSVKGNLSMCSINYIHLNYTIKMSMYRLRLKLMLCIILCNEDEDFEPYIINKLTWNLLAKNRAIYLGFDLKCRQWDLSKEYSYNNRDFEIRIFIKVMQKLTLRFEKT